MSSEKVQRILILDDQAEIVDACATGLRDHYHVIKTCSPFEAIAFADSGRGGIDLILSDFHMPGMNGDEFMQKIRSLGISIPVILYTGDMLDASKRNSLDGFLTILQKPFSMELLHREIKQALSKVEKEKQEQGTCSNFRQHIEAPIICLERILKKRDVKQFQSLTPQQALNLLGEGELYDIFMSWHWLNSLKKKMDEVPAKTA